MRKTILSLLFVMATIFAAQAQGPRLGIRAGANLAGFEGRDNNDIQRRWGFHAGLTTNFPLVENFFSLQPEVLYTQKGARNDGNQFNHRANFIEVPVLGRINAGPLYFEAGPQVAFRLNENTDLPGGFFIGRSDFDAMRRTHFGYAAGIGLASTPMGMSLGVRYNSDFGNAFNSDSHNLRYSVFMFTVGFAMPTR